MRETNTNGKQFHAVSLSGGKDSTAMLLLMIERGMPIDMVLSADTGMEFPEMYEHLSKLDKHLFRERGIHITTLRHPKGFEYLMFDEPKQKPRSLETINKTASELITDIDRHFAEICKERGIERPKDPEYELVTIPPSHEDAMAFAADYIVLLENSTAHSDFVSVNQVADSICRNDAQSIRDKLESLVEAEDDSGVYRGAVELLERFNSLYRKEWQAKEAPEAEKLYMVYNDKYIHVQRSDAGIDYTIYDASSAKALDGGVLDSTEQQLSAAVLEICKLHNIGDTAPIRLAPLELLKDLQAANELPLGAGEQITDEVVVPTDAADNMLPELEQAVPMPDPTLTVDDMRSYGYLDSDMLPLSKDRAVELLEHDITVYMLYPDNAEEMVFEAEDIIKHDGMFGITRPDWDAVKGHIPPRDVEQRFLNSPTDSMAIYQLRRDAPVELRFSNLGSLAAPPDPANYEAIYTREVYPDDDTGRILENFYYIFNDERPGDFVGHSLSVSDIVALKQDGKVSYHYCDSMGFQELPAFQKPENYLKAAEMSMEDDYGMIDGIINNGPKQPTVADLEAQVKAGMSISLMDLAAASHQEQDTGERKPSVLEQLKNQPVQERPHKTAPKKSAEKEL